MTHIKIKKIIRISKEQNVNIVRNGFVRCCGRQRMRPEMFFMKISVMTTTTVGPSSI